MCILVESIKQVYQLSVDRSNMKVNNAVDRIVKGCRFLIIFGSIMFLSVIFLASITSKEKLIWVLLFGIYLACYCSTRLSIWKSSMDNSIALKHDGIENLALISEQGTILREWRIINKNGIVIGKSTADVIVDVDLSQIADAPFISKRHAVLNFASGDWYIEDLDSRNGIHVKQPGKKSISIKGSGPVLLERGDMFYISNTVFVLR